MDHHSSPILIESLHLSVGASHRGWGLDRLCADGIMDRARDGNLLPGTPETEGPGDGQIAGPVSLLS